MTNPDPSSEKRIDREEYLNIAHEYRDALLKSLGVIGIQHSATRTIPENRIRELPVEAAESHTTTGSIGHSRQLIDVTNYTGDLDVPSAEDVQYMTIRETTGRAAIWSSATLGLGWETIPTPREVKLAEYLEGLQDKYITPDSYGGITPTNLVETLEKNLFGSSLRDDKIDLWLPPEKTNITNTTAVEDCVARVTANLTKEKWLHPIRHENGMSHSQEGEKPFSRFSVHLHGCTLAVESYNTGHTFEDRIWTYDKEGWHSLEGNSEGTGYLTVDEEQQPFTDNSVPPKEHRTIDTEVYTIPEFAKPEDILSSTGLDTEIIRPSPHTPNVD